MLLNYWICCCNDPDNCTTHLYLVTLPLLRASVFFPKAVDLVSVTISQTCNSVGLP